MASEPVDFEPQQRLHPLSWLFALTAYVKQFIVPVAVFIFLGARDDQMWGLIAVVPLIIGALWKQWIFRYGFGPRGLVIRDGLFFRAAGASGKPRGLIWKDCQFENGALFARERDTRHLAALVGVTISFEAVPGGDMEGLAAVGNLRHASAVFFYQQGQWSTVGKAVFNMNPDEALRHFEKQYERID